MATEQTVNVPQLLLIILLGGIAIRYFFFAPNGSQAGASSSRHGGVGAAGNSRAREADVERIQQMFPQVERRSIMWDLQRNGGNVAATTERILSGRGLEVPPQSFQPPPPPSATSSSTNPASSSTSPSQSKPLQPDLITRYNLKARLAEEEAAAEQRRNEAAAAEDVEGNSESGSRNGGGSGSGAAGRGKQAWSQNKVERQALLQKRREEMILSARRKMAARLGEDGASESSSGT